MDNQAIDPNHKHFRYNLTVSSLDSSFFGFALGIASFVTVIPLFVDSFTDSAILIGLISATHVVGWQLPQILTANRVSRLWRYKPMVLFLTVNERLPFLFVAIVAWQSRALGATWTLLLTFLLLSWRGLGGGLSATAWQSMTGKVIPPARHGLFFGALASTANLMVSIGAIVAGIILEYIDSPNSFALCFLLAFFGMSVSYGFLSRVREYETEPETTHTSQRAFWQGVRGILRDDHNFRWYLIARTFSQIGFMAVTFFTVFAVRKHGMSETTAGFMTALLATVQIGVSPLMGWLGDRWSHRELFSLGGILMTMSALLAIVAPSTLWFVVVFGLAGIANVTLWTVAIALTLQFGTRGSRPAYIGLTNTLTAPATLLAPLIGGWLADIASFEATFLFAAAGGVGMAFVAHFIMHDPVKMNQMTLESAAIPET